eukprot:CAMPEP_0194587760 /NCGR_PEP_ID=MMETSP0292-20121207/19356_1 /TAXON_ID=39354 /ORGANISM="Heterosigma akashiwo, Strain CCMP2393" /LENGTH=62 /DNA_ID=CAMNT_0039444093 /DNA_START=77 /DNA_END=265 /DNA_ORIENTATION=-
MMAVAQRGVQRFDAAASPTAGAAAAAGWGRCSSLSAAADAVAPSWERTGEGVSRDEGWERQH